MKSLKIPVLLNYRMTVIMNAQYDLIQSLLTVIIQIISNYSFQKYRKNYKSCGFMTVKTV